MVKFPPELLALTILPKTCQMPEIIFKLQVYSSEVKNDKKAMKPFMNLPQKVL